MFTTTIKRLTTIAAAAALTLACATGGAYAQLIDHNDGTISDTVTGLVWLKNANCFGRQDWDTAMRVAAALSSGVCGLSDKSSAGQWRLPSKDQLAVRAGNTAGFSNVTGTYYWSHNTHNWYREYAYFVSINNALTLAYYKKHTYFVWPVRDVHPRQGHRMNW